MACNRIVAVIVLAAGAALVPGAAGAAPWEVYVGAAEKAVDAGEFENAQTF